MCFILTITIIVIVIRNLRTLGGFSPSRFLPFQDEEDDAKECKEWKDCGRGRAMRIAECAYINKTIKDGGIIAPWKDLNKEKERRT